MPDNNPIFSQGTYDLGSSTSHRTLGDIDSSFGSISPHMSEYQCIVCKQPAQYQLIPKKGIPVSALIQDRGFVCQHCLKTHIDGTQYQLRDLAAKGKKDI